MEVAVHSAHKKHPASLMEQDRDIFYISMDPLLGQLRDKRDDLSFDSDVESGISSVSK
jgi:hypothetical protein